MGKEPITTLISNNAWLKASVLSTMTINHSMLDLPVIHTAHRPKAQILKVNTRMKVANKDHGQYRKIGLHQNTITDTCLISLYFSTPISKKGFTELPASFPDKFIKRDIGGDLSSPIARITMKGTPGQMSGLSNMSSISTAKTWERFGIAAATFLHCDKAISCCNQAYMVALLLPKLFHFDTNSD